MGGATAPIPGTPVTILNESILKLPQSPFLRIDTGPVSIPGISLHVGQFVNVTTCGGVPGASRRPLGLGDLPPL
jgi:hypothetical protein